MSERVFRKPRLPDLLCGLASGLMLYLSFPPAGLSILAWAGVAPILWVAVQSPKRAVVPAYIGGLIWFGGGLVWVRHATLAGMIILGLFMALYLVAFAAAAGALRRRLNVPLAIAAPLVMVTLEAIRSNFMTGFPYLLIGHTQINNLTLMQILDVTGVYGVSFLVIAFNGLLVEIALARRRQTYRPAVVSAVAVAIGLAGALLYGRGRLASIETHPGPEVCLVQANIPQDVKNRWESREAFNQAITDYIGRYAGLTYNSIKEAEGPSPLVIWPESALPGCYNDIGRPAIVAMRQNVTDMLKAYEFRRFLIGMNYYVRDGEGYEVFNSAIYIDGSHDNYERYDKIHLVPFGEYVPLSRLLFFVRHVVPYPQAFSSGSNYKLFDYEGRKFGVVICYEDVFPGLVRKFVSGGAEFIVNISNEGWFYRSAEADQHLAIARCRAIENRVGIVRATNSGVSCLIGPVGRIEKIIEKDGNIKLVKGWLTGRVPMWSGPATAYTRFGDVFALLCAACTAAISVLACFRSRHPHWARRE
ncbi:MAG: apolipoprotein N-acyltransferase [Planctomycetes bacterium]|nr:apolipoprotein N-acyltransferase [Planctomycetota bacterium]